MMKKAVMQLFSEEERELMCSDSKIGLLATIDDEGLPHLTFISSLQPLGSDKLTAGQFCVGLSKRFFRERPKVGFLIFSPQMDLWRGRVRYDKTLSSGPEYEAYNNKPIFRYNSYFGFGAIHYFDLVDITEHEKLTMGQIIGGAIRTRILKPFQAASSRGALNEISRALFSEIDSLKFISYIDGEGFPIIIPVIQAANTGRDRIFFFRNPYGRELAAIPDRSDVAILCVNLKMESVLVKGSYTKGKGLVPYGLVEINRVYNSMPPQPGYIYPRENRYLKVSKF
jgi:hypothetical protein